MTTNRDHRSPVLTFLGGAGTVTGSRFLLDTAGGRLLVDAGLFQGLKELRLRNRAPFPVDPSSIDAVVVTHAHLDHVGYLPVLVDQGFTGPVLATPGTIDLAGGRVLHHLARRLPDPRNTVVLPGFQADGARAVKMLGHYVPVRADVVPIDAFSVHADAHEMLAWLTPMPASDVAFVVHGSPEAGQALRKRLVTRRGWTAVVPASGERVRVD